MAKEVVSTRVAIKKTLTGSFLNQLFSGFSAILHVVLHSFLSPLSLSLSLLVGFLCEIKFLFCLPFYWIQLSINFIESCSCLLCILLLQQLCFGSCFKCFFLFLASQSRLFFRLFGKLLALSNVFQCFLPSFTRRLGLHLCSHLGVGSFGHFNPTSFSYHFCVVHCFLLGCSSILQSFDTNLILHISFSYLLFLLLCYLLPSLDF